MKLIDYFLLKKNMEELKKNTDELKKRHDYYEKHLKPRDRLCEIIETIKIEKETIKVSLREATTECERLKKENQVLRDSVLKILGPANLPEYVEDDGDTDHGKN